MGFTATIFRWMLNWYGGNHQDVIIFWFDDLEIQLYNYAQNAHQYISIIYIRFNICILHSNFAIEFTMHTRKLQENAQTKHTHTCSKF